MKISKSIKRFVSKLFLIMLSVSALNLRTIDATTTELPPFDIEKLDPETRAQLEEQFKKAQEEWLEKELKPILKVDEQMDFICEHLAQVINNNQLRNAPKKEAIAYIKNIRHIIQEIKKGGYVVIDPYSIKALLAIAEHIIDLLQTAIKSNFNIRPNPALDDIIKRSLQDETIDLEQIEQQCTDLEKKVSALDQAAQNVGLSLSNRAYRSLEKFCVDHRVIQRTGFTLLAGLGIYFIVSRLDKDIIQKIPGFKDSCVDKFKEKIGDAPREQYDPETKKMYINQNNLSLLGNIELFLGKYRLGLVDLTLPPLITWGLLAKPFANSFKEVKVWAETKWDSLRSYLRGGPLEKHAETWKREPKVRFKDIIGKEHHKNVLNRIVNYIRDPIRYDRAGISPEAGYLLAGPTRTGKTYMAEALAGEIKDALAENGNENFSFLEFNAADIKVWGIDTIMALAKESAPCVLFIDEIDMCGWQRERNAEGLSQVLTAMSGCMNKNRSKTVIIVGATNKPENLDQALLQKGRFGKVLWFDYPTLGERTTYLRRELENRSIMSIDDAYLQKLAQETDRCSFDHLNSIIITALQKSKADGQALSEKHLEESFDEEIRHVIYEDIPMSDAQKRVLAVHQAGHTLATLLLDETPHITKVTIRPINTEIVEEHVWAKYTQNDGKAKDDNLKKAIPIEYGKLFSSKPQHADTINTYQELINKCCIALAGHVAEKLLLGSSSYTYHKEDREKALNIAKYLTFEGVTQDALPKKIKGELQEKAYALMLECEQRVQALFADHQDKLDALAKALQEKQTLASVEILEILGLDKVQETAAPASATSLPEQTATSPAESQAAAA